MSEKININSDESVHDHEPVYVNGPFNAFRLEGKINDINKVVYLFGDRHMPIQNETKCDSFLSVDWINYFISTMKTTDNKIEYDFLFENNADIYMFSRTKNDDIYRRKYIAEISKYVDRDIIINKKEQNNETIFTNVGSKS